MLGGAMFLYGQDGDYEGADPSWMFERSSDWHWHRLSRTLVASWWSSTVTPTGSHIASGVTNVGSPMVPLKVD